MNKPKYRYNNKTGKLDEVFRINDDYIEIPGFIKGNQFWLARSRHGRNPIFKNPEQLWEGCLDYFQWVEDNPLKEQKATQFQGEFVKTNVNKMRAMTINGLCIFLDIDDSTWFDYAKKEDFSNVTKKAEKIIRDQKFAGASADLLNANIIARDLGLVDKKEHGSDPKKPLRMIASEMSAEEATAAYKALLDD
jgi:hypothetical protein